MFRSLDDILTEEILIVWEMFELLKSFSVFLHVKNVTRQNPVFRNKYLEKSSVLPDIFINSK